MYLIENESIRAVVPGFLMGRRADAMMPEYTRYMATLPFFIAANVASLLISALGLALHDDRWVLAAYGLFMTTFSARMLTQRLVCIRLNGTSVALNRAPLSVRLNAFIVSAALLAMGSGFIGMQGEFDSYFFDVFGAMMMTAGGAWLFSLGQRQSSQQVW